MWKYAPSQIDINMDDEVLHKLQKYAKVGGLFFLVLGAIGIIFPTVMTMSTVLFVSYLMLLSGLTGAVLTWMSNPSDWAGWLKSAALIAVALYMFFYPLQGAGTLGLLLSIYYFMNAFAGFGIALASKEKKSKLIWFLNATTSLALAIVFIINWPFSSVWLVGFFLGISLFLDGIALLFGGLFLSKMRKE